MGAAPFRVDTAERLNEPALLNVRESSLDEWYLMSYRLFLEFFRKRIAVPDIQEHDAKIATTLVYSWMGRAKLNPVHWDNFARMKPALLRSRVEMTLEQLSDIQSFIGGSLIATSKFLHFTEPSTYAFWDRHVARAAYGLKSQPRDVDKQYLAYLCDLKKLRISECIRSQVHSIVGEASELRVKEFALFHLGISRW